MEQFKTAEDFLAVNDSDLEQLEQVFEEPIKASRREDWTEMQQARADYLKEWEEDMRFAQELANEGM